MNVELLNHVARLLSAALLSAACFTAQAQTPVHKHYDVPEEAGMPSPTGALAPRLQNVGKHVFQIGRAHV